jgi:hypothetical protein
VLWWCVEDTLWGSRFSMIDDCMEGLGYKH